MSSLSMAEAKKNAKRFDEAQSEAQDVNKMIGIMQRNRGVSFKAAVFGHRCYGPRYSHAVSTSDPEFNRSIASALEEYVSRLESEMREIEGRFGEKGTTDGS